MSIRKLKGMEKYLLSIIITYIIVVAVMNPRFMSWNTLYDFMRTSSATLILAMGALTVLISGGMDVSFTAVAVVSSYSSIKLMMYLNIDSIIFVLVTSMIIGTLLGLINTLIIHVLKLSTFIVTLGTSNIFYGAMTTFIGTKSISVADKPKSLLSFGALNIASIPGFFVIAIIVIILTWFILYRTKIGRSIFALGNSEESSKRSGINVLKTKCFIFAYMGLLAGLMGIINFSEIDLINPVSLVGTELMINAAVVIGGVRLSGGEGTIFGAILGVIIIQLFKSTLVFIGLPTSLNDLFIGGILLISVVILSVQERKSNMEQLIFND